MIDVFWPVFESHRAFRSLQDIFRSELRLSKEISKFEIQKNRTFGKFYLVSFSGVVFKEENGLSYIYHEKDDVTIEILTSRLKEQFQQNEFSIQIIPPQLDIEKSKVPSTGFIRVRQILPFFSNDNLLYRLTPYEQNSKVFEFYFDQQIANDHEDLSIENTNVQRFKYHAEHSIPYVVKRVAIEEEKIIPKDYEPIHFQYKVIKHTKNLLKNAVKAKEFTTIQRVLQDNLIQNIEVSPIKIQEVFVLSKKYNNKYVKKIDHEFKQYSFYVEKSLEAHGVFSIGTTSGNLHQQLESAFISSTVLIKNQNK